MLNECFLLEALAEHLSIGDLFRLDRALGRTPAWTPTTVALVASRMGLKVERHLRKTKATLSPLRRRMAAYKHRCVECAAHTRCARRVCAVCAINPTAPVAMCTRTLLREINLLLGCPVPNLLLRIRERLTPIKRGRSGQLFYWWHEARILLFHNTIPFY